MALPFQRVALSCLKYSILLCEWQGWIDINLKLTTKMVLVSMIEASCCLMEGRIRVHSCVRGWVGDHIFKGTCSDPIGFFSKLLRFWYHKIGSIFLIIILKFHVLIPSCSEENIKNVPILLITVVTTIQNHNLPLFELQRQFIFGSIFGWLSSSSQIVGPEVKLQYEWNQLAVW